MKRLFITVLLIISSIGLGLSQKVFGVIKNQEQQPVASLEILLSSADGEVLKSGLSEEDGSYSIELPRNGEYHFHVYYFGAEVFQKSLNVNGDLEEDITVTTQVDLDAISVTARRKLIEHKIDRLVYNVENSIASSGTSLIDLLSSTPMVLVSESSISIVGKSGVSVMIDDKLLNISGSELINYLRSLRSDDIKRIEVITAPPARYDAQGNSGMINIILKQNPNLGWSGSLSSAYIQNTYAGYSNSGALNYQSGKLKSSLRLRQYHNQNRATERINILGKGASILSTDTRRDQYTGVGVNLNMNYSISERSNIGIIYDIGQMDDDMDIVNTSIYKTFNSLDSILDTDAKHSNSYITQTINAYHDIVLGEKKSSNLSFVFNYFSNLPNNVIDFITNSSEGNSNIVRNESDVDYQIWSLQSDLNSEYKWFTIETGVKYTDFTNNSDVAYFNFIDDSYQIDLERSNLFEYDEKNIAGYTSLSKQLSEKIKAKAGLRYEHSIIEGFSPTTGEYNRREFGNLFPTVYLSYQPNGNQFLSFNYSRRINRPSFRSLNPFRWYSNPLTYYTGNPVLLPSYNNNFEISHNYKGLLSTNLFYQRLSNGIGRTVEVIDDVERRVSFDNILTTQTLGGNVSLSLNPIAWLESYFTFVASYSDSKSSLPSIVAQQGFAAYYLTNNTITLNADKKMYLLVNFWHSLSSTQGNSFSEGLYALDMGFRFSLLSNKLQVSSRVRDIFRTAISRGELFFEGFDQTYNNYYDNRSFTLSITFNFGKTGVKGSNKRIRFDETIRGN